MVMGHGFQPIFVPMNTFPPDDDPSLPPDHPGCTSGEHTIKFKNNFCAAGAAICDAPLAL
jgi:hypothetical protein